MTHDTTKQPTDRRLTNDLGLIFPLLNCSLWLLQRQCRCRGAHRESARTGQVRDTGEKRRLALLKNMQSPFLLTDVEGVVFR